VNNEWLGPELVRRGLRRWLRLGPHLVRIDFHGTREAATRGNRAAELGHRRGALAGVER
jgi:hypothetical protein